MEFYLFSAAALSLVYWIWRGLLHNPFWRDEDGQYGRPSDQVWPDVVALLVAQDQAEVLAETLDTLLAQNYAAFHVIVIDDNSRDGSARAARQAATDAGETARLTVISAKPPRPGWSRRVWALAAGREQARIMAPSARYLWLTDAETSHWSNNLTEMVTRAEGNRLNLVSYLPIVHCERLWQRLLIPAFAFFFQERQPFALVNSRRLGTAAATSASTLVNAERFDSVGGFAAIKDRAADDYAPALAARVKQAARRRGHGIWIGLSEETVRVPPDNGSWSIRDAAAAYASGGGEASTLVLSRRILTFVLTYLVPPAAVLWALFAAIFLDLDDYLSGFLTLLTGFAAWAAMAFAAWPTYRLFGQDKWLTPLLPITALVHAAIGAGSARRAPVTEGPRQSATVRTDSMTVRLRHRLRQVGRLRA